MPPVPDPAEPPPRPCPRKLGRSIQHDFQRTHRTAPDRAGTAGLDPGILSTSRTDPDFSDGCQGPLNPQVLGSSPRGRTPETPVLARILPVLGFRREGRNGPVVTRWSHQIGNGALKTARALSKHSASGPSYGRRGREGRRRRRDLPGTRRRTRRAPEGPLATQSARRSLEV